MKSLETVSLDGLSDLLPQCQGRHRRVLTEQLRRAQKLRQQQRPVDRLIDQIAVEIQKSIALRHRRWMERPRPALSAELPILSRLDEIKTAITQHQVIVLCGETGSGKTTQLPQICLELGRGVDGMIGHTQPRRIAARTVAQRITAELGPACQQAVGYKVRFGDHTSEQTYIKLMTDGILLAEIQTDRLLEQYDTIIIDEAHERSLNIDFLLGYLKLLLPRRPDLKVIVTSATIDPQRFSRHFDNAPIVTVSGRTYPVQVHYRPRQSEDPEEEDLLETHAIAAAVDELAAIGPGDVLVFLAGERQIREAAEELRKHHPPQTEILPLYARLGVAEQQQVFQPHGRRRIVLATNVAETSLTVPGIKYVIDTGTARISRYSARSKVQRLPIEPISQASADQRKGRCGRTSDGVCIRLFSEEDFNARPAFTEPEILRTNLASVILQMTTANLGQIEQFPFVEKPDLRLIRDGYLTLHELGAVDDENRLTAIGKQLGRLPIDPRLGRMLLAAEEENCLTEVLIIAAALSVQDPRERPVEQAAVADEAHRQFASEESDFFTFLNLWDFFREKSRHLSNSQLRKQCKQQFLSYMRLREWHEVHQQIHAQLTEMGFKPNPKPALPERIIRALLSGLLTNVGSKTDSTEYAGVRGSKFYLFPGSGLFKKKPAWVMAGEIVETQKVYARTLARILPEWIEQVGAHLVKRTYGEPQWNPQRADVTASERVSLKGLIIVPHRTVSYGPIDPRTSREVFIHFALVEGEWNSKALFFTHNRALQEHVKTLEAKFRQRNLLADVQHRFAFYNSRIPAGIYNGHLFEKWRVAAEKENTRLLFMGINDIAGPEVSAMPERDFPDELIAGNLKIPLRYLHDTGRADDGITAVIPLALLNQAPATPFDWLVPGRLVEKVIELIRTLPKPTRTRLVPAPESAARAVATLPVGFEKMPMLETIARHLGKLIGEVIPVGAFELPQLPTYLTMNFQIIDAAGKPIASGRDLVALRGQLGIKARESFAVLPPREFTRDGISSWDFGDLPEQIEIHRDGATFSGFPAVVDLKSAAGLRVLDSREASVTANRGGVRRLFMLQLATEMRRLARGFDDIPEMSLLYKPLGSWNDLRDDILAAAVTESLFPESEDIRTRDAFIAKAERGWRKLPAAACGLNKSAIEILRLFGPTQAALEKSYPPLLMSAVAEMREQLARLMPKTFLSSTPPEALPHLPRYIRAIQIRLAKLQNAGLNRDQEATAVIRPISQAYAERQRSHRQRGIYDPELGKVYWMLQELRVSLFAQELKTPISISPQRVLKQLQSVQQ